MINQDTMIDGQQQITKIVDATCTLSKTNDSNRSALKEEKQIVKQIRKQIKEGVNYESDEVEFAIRKDVI